MKKLKTEIILLDPESKWDKDKAKTLLGELDDFIEEIKGIKGIVIATEISELNQK